MGRSNQTQVAVLGALNIEPMTAYALREAIRDVLGHFWSESFGQIYPTLHLLEKEGCVRRSGGSRARSSVFAITQSGRTRLAELLSEPIQETPPRNGLMLRLYFGRVLGREHCRQLVQDARTTAERQLAEYRELLDRLGAAEGDTPDWPYIRLTILAGIHQAQAVVAWTNDAFAGLDALPRETDTP